MTDALYLVSEGTICVIIGLNSLRFAVLVPEGNAFKSRWSFRPAVMMETLHDVEGIDLLRRQTNWDIK